MPRTGTSGRSSEGPAAAAWPKTPEAVESPRNGTRRRMWYAHRRAGPRVVQPDRPGRPRLPHHRGGRPGHRAAGGRLLPGQGSRRPWRASARAPFSSPGPAGPGGTRTGRSALRAPASPSQAPPPRPSTPGRRSRVSRRSPRPLGSCRRWPSWPPPGTAARGVAARRHPRRARTADGRRRAPLQALLQVEQLCVPCRQLDR